MPSAVPASPSRPATRRVSLTGRRRCVAWLALSPLTARADTSAAELAQRVFDRPAGRDVTAVSRMELAEKGRSPRVRRLVSYRVDRGGGRSAYLVRFLDPKDIAGVGLLSLLQADGSTEQSLYLPELDRVRRVASDRKGGRFVGSDLYFEDLQERKPSRDTHRRIGSETIGGVPCEVVESVPVDAADSVYSRRLSWIDPAAAMALRVDYFERDEQPSKRWQLATRQKVQGYWTVMDSTMTDLQRQSDTRLVVEQVRYDRKLPTKLFTPQGLADEAIEAEYRL